MPIRVMCRARHLLCVSCALLVAAGSLKGQSAGESDLPPEIQSLVDAARATPAEFHADALIRLAGSPLVTVKRARMALVEEAFTIAGNAQEPVKRESAVAAMDTREGIRSRGFDLDLDALSLRSRAAEAMLKIDPPAAREMFAALRPALAALTCEDALIYELSGFYARLAAVFAKGFTAEDREQQADVRFLEPQVSDLTSPAQVAGLAELLRQVDVDRSELGALTQLFAWSLERLSGDSRSFFQAPGAPARVMRLIEHARGRDVAPDRLIEALRTYLVRHLGAERCRTSDVNRRYWLRQVDDFNDSVRTLGTTVGPPITAREVEPTRVNGEPVSHAFWQTPQARELQARGARVGSGTSALELMKYADALRQWDWRSENDRADHFHQKSLLYSRLLKAVPAGHEREQILSDYVVFLATYDVERDSRIMWAVHLEDALRVIAAWPEEERRTALSLVDRFGNATMKLAALWTFEVRGSAFERSSSSGNGPNESRPVGIDQTAVPRGG